MEQVEFTDHNTLKLQLKPPHFKRSYGVVYTYTSGSKEDTVKFDLDVTYVKTIIDRSRVFKLERTSPVYVNDIAPDLVADQLAYECGKVFYPLQLEIGFDGSYMGVFNYQEILSRWKDTRSSVEEYFKGETTEKYLQLMELSLSSQEKVDLIFRDELFCAVFFSPVYRAYGENFILETHSTFPVSGRCAPVRFKGTAEVNPLLNAAGHIEIQYTGEADDERTAGDLKEEQSFPIERLMNPEAIPVTGDYTIRLVLEKETRSIRSLVGRWRLELGDIQETELKIFEWLEEEDQQEMLQENVSKGMVFLDGNHEPKEKKITNPFKFLWD
jgi:hypothetical protein